MHPPSDPDAKHGETGSKRLDPGLVELVKALARSTAAQDIANIRRGVPPHEDLNLR